MRLSLLERRISRIVGRERELAHIEGELKAGPAKDEPVWWWAEILCGVGGGFCFLLAWRLESWFFGIVAFMLVAVAAPVFQGMADWRQEDLKKRKAQLEKEILEGRE